MVIYYKALSYTLKTLVRVIILHTDISLNKCVEAYVNMLALIYSQCNFIELLHFRFYMLLHVSCYMLGTVIQLLNTISFNFRLPIISKGCNDAACINYCNTDRIITTVMRGQTVQERRCLWWNSRPITGHDISMRLFIDGSKYSSLPNDKLNHRPVPLLIFVCNDKDKLAFYRKFSRLTENLKNYRHILKPPQHSTSLTYLF